MTAARRTVMHITCAFRAPVRIAVSMLWRLLACALWPALAWSIGTTTANLGDLSIEELMNESITSVSKKEQRVADAPAAIYVLTGEEILRSGVYSLSEALRMVPGLSVAQVDTQNWIVAARGFAAQYAGELLVLVDGRTIYDPFYSGVNWARQDLLLEDIDRIEVIRGPGAALWGANAVNGVINIITKQASATQGALLVGSWGQTNSYGAIQYGGEAGDVYYRAFAKYDDFAASSAANGVDAVDPWHIARAGFRTDWHASETNNLTLLGGIYRSDLQVVDPETSLTPPYMIRESEEQRTSGGHVLGRWEYGDGKGSRWLLQAYYDRTQQRAQILGITRDTFDLELQRQFDMGSRQTVLFGGGYRYTQADYSSSYFLSYARPHDSGHLSNVFVQDEISIAPSRVKLILGSKFEDSYFRGIETQPSARILWTPDGSRTVWAAVSRAVSTPNFAQTGLRVNFAAFGPRDQGSGLPTVVSKLPNPDLQSEEEIAYELGLRARSSEKLFVDLATFFNDYSDLITVESSGTVVEMTPPPVHLAVTSRYVNKMHGHTYGLELAPTWQVTEGWKVAGGYTWLHMDLHSDALNHAGEQEEGNSPKHQAQLRSSMQWPRRVTFDTTLYYVDSLPNQGIGSYIRLDARVGWKPTEHLDLSVGGANLAGPRHAEFRGVELKPVEMGRSLYAKAAWWY